MRAVMKKEDVMCVLWDAEEKLQAMKVPGKTWDQYLNKGHQKCG
jgi:hypothetical protein